VRAPDLVPLRVRAARMQLVGTRGTHGRFCTWPWCVAGDARESHVAVVRRWRRSERRTWTCGLNVRRWRIGWLVVHCLVSVGNEC
jgi:hypothetical protein